MRDEQRLVPLVPPTSLDESDALASAGDLAVPFLVESQHTAPENYGAAVACLRTLGAIGTETALDAIAGYARDTRPMVHEAVIAAWPYFDADEFGRRVLPRMARGTYHLELTKPLSLAGRERASHLTGLVVQGGSNLSDLSPLAGLTALRSLTLYNAPVRDAGLAHLAGLTGLRSLMLYNAQATGAGLAHLAGLPDLQSLDLSCSPVTDAGLTPLAGLTGLESVDLRTPGVTKAGLLALTHIPNVRVVH